MTDLEFYSLVRYTDLGPDPYIPPVPTLSPGKPSREYDSTPQEPYYPRRIRRLFNAVSIRKIGDGKKHS